MRLRRALLARLELTDTLLTARLAEGLASSRTAGLAPSTRWISSSRRPRLSSISRSLSVVRSDVWPVSSIPADRITEVVDICRDLYFVHLLGTLAVPDMLESVAPIARSFHEVEKLAVDSWT